MRSALSTLGFRRVRTVDAALKIMNEAPETVPIAGCTDVLVSLNFGTQKGAAFLDLTGLGALKRITTTDGVLSIGALAPYTTIINSRLVRKQLPMLVAAAKEIGGAQIQNRGTLGGNIANASPAGDSLPVLAAAKAVIVLQSVLGERRVPFAEFYTGYRTTVRRPDELVTAIEIAEVDGKQWFRKVGTRAAQAISKVVMAGVRSDKPSIAIGSVGPTVVRLTRTEGVLAGGGSIDDAAEELAREIHPIDDLRSTASYRRAVAVNLLRAFWTETE